MKTEFLKNFKVGDQELPKEIIDAILAENGRDIEAAKKPFADYDTIKTQLTEAQTTIQGLKDQDIEGVKKSAKEWEDKYNAAIADHQKQMADRDFNDRLGEAIKAMNGRSVNAILGELGTEKIAALKESKNQEADIKTALETVQKASGYLFGEDPAPYPSAGGTGGNPAGGKYSPEIASIRAAAGLKID